MTSCSQDDPFVVTGSAHCVDRQACCSRYHYSILKVQYEHTSTFSLVNQLNPCQSYQYVCPAGSPQSKRCSEDPPFGVTGSVHCVDTRACCSRYHFSALRVQQERTSMFSMFSLIHQLNPCQRIRYHSMPAVRKYMQTECTWLKEC